MDAGSGRVWLGLKFERPAGKFTKAGFSTASTFGFARDDKRKRVTESDMLAWLGQAEGHLRAELPKYNEAGAVQARELLGELVAPNGCKHGSIPCRGTTGRKSRSSNTKREANAEE